MFILWFCIFFLVLRSSDFSVTGINNVYLLIADWIFSLTFFVGSFEVCYSFVGFAYVYCLIHQNVVVFCLVFLRKSAAQVFSNVHVSFVFRGRSAVQFFLYLSVLVMFISVLCSVMFSFLYFSILVMLMSFLCSIIELLFSFFVIVNFSNARACFVLHHVQFLYLPNLLMLFKCSLCILICKCIWLFLSLSVAWLFFDTLHSDTFLFFSILVMFFKCSWYTVNSLISGHHQGNNFCPLIGDVRLLESLTFLTFCCLGRRSLKVLS